jgi:uncharacterized protein YutE (UPF0331/DUF86 family)
MTDFEKTSSYELRNSIEKLRKAADHLRRSMRLIENAEIDWRWPSEEHMDILEAFSSRYARLSDIVLKKVFRLLDEIEQTEEGTMIDVANRAEKRGLIDSATEFRRMRKLRNEITHEYALTELPEIVRQLIEFTPALLDSVERAAKYSEDLYSKL